jgi:alpha-L-fucosidase
MNPMPHRKARFLVLAHVLAASLFLATFLVASPSWTQTTTYTASAASLAQHTNAPEWFQDAKFGVYFHWGVYSVPAYGSEWYPRNMYATTGSTSNIYQHHLATYGDPFTNWPYNNFIDGANDKAGQFTQFAPKLTSAGGDWDPDTWASIIKSSGARYAGPSMEHHDGFSMWDSKANPWNSVAHGPKLNLAQYHVNAFRKVGLPIVAALHTAYHFNGYYQWVPEQTDPQLKILYGQQSTAVENDLWLAKLKEVIDEFEPDIIWQDFDLNRVAPDHLMGFLAYYYNAAEGWGKDVVATYKDGMQGMGGVYDYESGGPAAVTTPYWLSDDAVGRDSWCYTNGMGYHSALSILDSFIDLVSKGGNLLLNISPMANGIIPQAQQDILSTMGSFLNLSGTAVYATRPWKVYGEGPTKMGSSTGQAMAPVEGTSSDVRYTVSKDGNTLYAIFMGWPARQFTMASVTSSAFPVGTGKVYLFGSTPGTGTALTFTQDGSGLHVTFPSAAPYTASAYAISISKAGTPPGPIPPMYTPSTGLVGSDAGASPGTDDGGGSSSGSSSGSNADDYDATSGTPVTTGSSSGSGGSSGSASSSGSAGSSSGPPRSATTGDGTGDGGTSDAAATDDAAGRNSNSGCAVAPGIRKTFGAEASMFALMFMAVAGRMRRGRRRP